MESVVAAAIEGALVAWIIEEFVVDDMSWYSKNDEGGWDVHGGSLLTVVSAPVTDLFSTWLCAVNRSAPVTDPICNWMSVVNMTSDPGDVDDQNLPVMKRIRTHSCLVSLLLSYARSILYAEHILYTPPLYRNYFIILSPMFYSLHNFVSADPFQAPYTLTSGTRALKAV